MKMPISEKDFPTMPEAGSPTSMLAAVGHLADTRVERGIAQVGNKPNPTEQKQISVQFTTPFQEKPTVVANALAEDGKDYPDGFTVTLANVSTTGFEARVRRVDSTEQTWGQSLQLAWVALGR